MSAVSLFVFYAHLRNCLAEDEGLENHENPKGLDLRATCSTRHPQAAPGAATLRSLGLWDVRPPLATRPRLPQLRDRGGTRAARWATTEPSPRHHFGSSHDCFNNIHARIARRLPNVCMRKSNAKPSTCTSAPEALSSNATPPSCTSLAALPSSSSRRTKRKERPSPGSLPQAMPKAPN